MNPINSSGVLPFGDVTNTGARRSKRKSIPSQRLKDKKEAEQEARAAARANKAVKEARAAARVAKAVKAAQASLGLSQASNDKESNGKKRRAEVEPQQLSPQQSKRPAKEEVREFWEQRSPALLNGSDTGLETPPVLPGTPSLKNAELTGHLTALLKQYEKKLGEKSPLPPLFSELEKPACTAAIFSPDKTDFPFDDLENVENLGGLGFYGFSPSTFDGIVNEHYGDNLKSLPHSANSLGCSSDNVSSKAKTRISSRFNSL